MSTQPEVSLSVQVRLLHDLRQKLASAKGAVEEIEAQARQDHRDAYHQEFHWKELVGAQEAAVREQAIREYQDTGDKAPSPGIGIRKVERYKYDRDTRGQLRATKYLEPRVAIARDLGTALGPDPMGPL